MHFTKLMTRHGSPLYVYQMPHVRSVAAGILVFAGTQDETGPKEAGIAHALEHMVFQGNGRLPNSQAISDEIELVGGSVNAWTSKEMTLYHRVVPDDALHIAVDSLVSQVATPLFRPDDITKEMQNVIQEIKRAHDAPAGACMRLFDEVVYGEHPLGKPTLGTEESVAAFTQDDFRQFHERLYYPENFAFFVVGNVTLAQAEHAFNSASFGDLHGKGRNVGPSKMPVTVSGQKRIVERDIKQANLNFGTLVGPSADASTRALDFYSTMLDGGMSFPLFQEVRDKRGLCYSVAAHLTPWTEHGVFQIAIGTQPSRLGEAIDCIHQTIISTYGDAELFQKARRYLLGKTALGFVEPGTILYGAAWDLVFYGHPRSPAEVRNEIEEYTLDSICAAVEKYLLNAGAYSYAYVVPHGTKI